MFSLIKSDHLREMIASVLVHYTEKCGLTILIVPIHTKSLHMRCIRWRAFDPKRHDLGSSCWKVKHEGPLDRSAEPLKPALIRVFYAMAQFSCNSPSAYSGPCIQPRRVAIWSTCLLERNVALSHSFESTAEPLLNYRLFFGHFFRHKPPSPQ